MVNISAWKTFGTLYRYDLPFPSYFKSNCLHLVTLFIKIKLTFRNADCSRKKNLTRYLQRWKTKIKDNHEQLKRTETLHYGNKLKPQPGVLKTYQCNPNLTYRQHEVQLACIGRNAVSVLPGVQNETDT